MSAGMLGLGVPVILGTFVAKWPDEDAPPSGVGATVRAKLQAATYHAILRVQEANAAAFLVTTPQALSRMTSSDRVKNRVHWLPHGIDVGAFAPQPTTDAGEHTILFLASVAKKKGIFTLLESFEIVRREIPAARLVIAGHGPHFERLQRAVAAAPSAAHIAVLGQVDRTLVPQLMADCAVYCLPSFGEPYATTVIEAMACAKPVVVTDSGGIQDMIAPAGGRRVRTGDAHALANALCEILGSPALARDMGDYNRSVAERNYDWPRVTEKLEAVYRSVVERRTPA
jgi:glycosyltransferase involved in cell wall biosynthesis